MVKFKFKEKYIYWVFEYSLIIKIVNSVWEILLGSFLLFDKHLRHAIYLFAQDEFSENPNNFVFHYIQNLITQVSHGTLVFISVYLISQAIIKIFLISGMALKKLWAYQAAMYAFIAFTFYQIYRFNHTHAIFLIILSSFDIITILLIEHEYKRAKGHLSDY